MSSQNFRSKLLLGLFFLAVILLALNIYFGSNLVTSHPGEQNLNVADITQRFRNILNDFSIGNNLVKESKTVDKNTGENIQLIKVQVPEDLTIPEILREIYQTFSKDSLKIISEEIVRDGKSVLTLKKNTSTVLKAEFNYAKNIFRNKESIAFIVKDISPENLSDNELIESSTKFNLLLRPESKIIPYLEYLNENGKQLSILIDDNISEQKYRLAGSHSEQRIITVVQSIVKDFSTAVCLIIDDKSDFYKSNNRMILTRELTKRKIKLFKLSDFTNLDDEKTITENFISAVENINADKKIIFILKETAYIALNTEIKIFKKRGFRIVDSSLLF